MIDLKRYNRLKETDNVGIVKIDNDFYVSFARYNPEDGTKLEPELQKVTYDELMDLKTKLLLEIEAINEIVYIVGLEILSI